jgi:hypothetical protein
MSLCIKSVSAPGKMAAAGRSPAAAGDADREAATMAAIFKIRSIA